MSVCISDILDKFFQCLKVMIILLRFIKSLVQVYQEQNVYYSEQIFYESIRQAQIDFKLFYTRPSNKPCLWHRPCNKLLFLSMPRFHDFEHLKEIINLLRFIKSQVWDHYEQNMNSSELDELVHHISFNIPSKIKDSAKHLRSLNIH